MKCFFRLLFIVLFALSSWSCTCRREPRIPLERIDVEVSVIRFDRDLFTVSFDSLDCKVDWLVDKYGEFFRLFCEGVIGIGTPEESGFNQSLLNFVADPMVRRSYSEVLKTFPSTYDLDAILTDAFKRYHYHFPTKHIPTIYAFISGYNNSVMLADSLMGVGLERYLGADYENYSLLGIYRYISRNMHPAKIPSDLIHTWGYGEFPFSDSVDNVINNLIYEGMLLYFTKALLPDHHDTLILGFTSDQLRWCRRNETQMWTHLIENKLLFDTDHFTIRKLVNPAPFTQLFTHESPGRAGAWLGYRIVSRFMQRNPDYTLKMLMNETDYQMILSKSRYSP